MSNTATTHTHTHTTRLPSARQTHRHRRATQARPPRTSRAGLSGASRLPQSAWVCGRASASESVSVKRTCSCCCGVSVIDWRQRSEHKVVRGQVKRVSRVVRASSSSPKVSNVPFVVLLREVRETKARRPKNHLHHLLNYLFVFVSHIHIH